jgi:predicted DNA-binding transcriptional regulator
MYLDIFQELGLTPNEAKIYETLIETGETTVGEIAIKGKIHRRNVYDAISRLIEKGLVFQILTKGENIYKAVDPAKLLELIKEREDKFKKVLPELTKLYQGTPRLQEAFVYRGIEGFKNYLRDILRIVSQGGNKDVYFIGAKGLWFDPKLKTFLKSFLEEAKRLDIKYHHIFDSELKNRQDILTELSLTVDEAGQPTHKFFPSEYSTKAACDIFGDHVVTFTGLGHGQIDDDIAIYVLVDGELADGYRTWFNFMWDHLT